MQHIRVCGRLYEWAVSITSEFGQLRRLSGPDRLEVLRIVSADRTFDIAIRIDVYSHSGGSYRYLGPALVLGVHVPRETSPAKVGIMIDLRPKVRIIPFEGPSSASVERVVQWCQSAHFRVRRVNSSGGRWVGYGYPPDA